MKSKAERTKVFLHILKFQKFISPMLLAVTVLLLTAVLSLQASSSVASVEAAASELVCPADIISYWTLDESSGDTFADSILINDATCPGGANCPASVAGRVNLARDFDGSDRLTVSHDASLNWTGNPSFSIELWVRAPDQGCPNERVFIGKRTGSDTGARWWLGCARLSDNTDRAAFYLRDSTGINALTLFSPSAIDDNNWHHLVAVRDETANTTRLYLDGAEVAANSHSFNGNFANTGALTIGYDNATTPTAHATATIDEVALYNRTLTPAEVLDHYNSGAGKAYCTPAVAPQIEPIDDQTAAVGVPFTYDVEASGDPAPAFALIDGPEDMAIDTNTGLIEWTPGATGPVNVTVRASNIAGDDEESFTVTVNSVPVIDAIADQTAVVGVPFTYLVEASGDPAPSFSLTTSPVGMTINVTTGEINWTPTAAGSTNVTVLATNDFGSDTEDFAITVSAPPVITPIATQTAVVGQLFTYDVEASGNPAPAFSLVTSPVGMTINPTSGIIAWTPTSAGTVNVTVQAQNLGGTTTANFTIAVAEPGVEGGHFLFLPLVIRNP